MDALFDIQWKNHRSVTSKFMESLRDDVDLVDFQFVCKNQQIFAHRIVLAACSPVLRDFIKTDTKRNPIYHIKDVRAQVLESLLDYLYTGEAQVDESDLQDFIHLAESFQIQGISDSNDAAVRVTRYTGQNLSIIRQKTDQETSLEPADVEFEDSMENQNDESLIQVKLESTHEIIGFTEEDELEMGEPPESEEEIGPKKVKKFEEIPMLTTMPGFDRKEQINLKTWLRGARQRCKSRGCPGKSTRVCFECNKHMCPDHMKTFVYSICKFCERFEAEKIKQIVV